jgi:hypothetical protein
LFFWWTLCCYALRASDSNFKALPPPANSSEQHENSMGGSFFVLAIALALDPATPLSALWESGIRPVTDFQNIICL